MKVSYELKQGYIDIWNEESEEWDRYIKVNKKSVAEEEKKIPEKLPIWATRREDKEYTNIEYHILEIAKKVDEIIDYLKSKGE